MASKIDQSLEDIISQTKGARRGGGRGRGAGGRGGRVGAASRGRASGGAARNNGFGGARRGGGGGGVRTSGGGTFRRSGNADGVWAHDKFQETSLGGARKGLRSAAAPAGGAGSKITINNLDYGVSDADIMELFGELGSIRYASVHYDRTGRSMGKADVVFERRSEAQLAIQQYNGVPLDGRAMMITWASVAAAPAVAAAPVGRNNLNRVQGGRVNRKSSEGRGGSRGGRGTGGGRGRGGRGGRNNPKPPTAAELDAELDAYVSQNQK